jgi:sugar phosphate isomerase/epimerase
MIRRPVHLPIVLVKERPMISRRDFLVSIPLTASLPALARAAAGPPCPVGCQMNAWQIKPGDFATLLKHAEDLKRLGYQGFECNVRFVEGQFGNARKAREVLRRTGIRFYAPHNGLQLGMERLERNADGAAGLGAERFVLSGGGTKILKPDNRIDEEALAGKIAASTT